MLQDFECAAPAAFVVAGSANVAALRKRLADDPSVTVFCETESLDALRLMLSRPPKMLALDSSVVRTARGALLVSRLQGTGVDVRVLTDDEWNLPMLLAKPGVGLHAASRPLDACGTRAAKRFPMTPETGVVIDGQNGRLVNLSTSGAQIIVTSRVQPGQNLRVTLPDEASGMRLHARVAWSAVEMAQSAVQYRAGVEFVAPVTSIIEAFCLRHGACA